MDNSELQILYKNNLLIKSSYNLSLIENRVYLTILYNLQKKSNSIYECTLHKSTFQNLIHKKIDHTPKGIKSILTTLKKKMIEIHEYRDNNIGVEYEFGLIGGHKYNPDTQEYTIYALPQMYDLLISYMNEGYTPLNLSVLLGINNYYAQRLYELLRLWSGVKTKINYSLDYLRDCLQIKDKYPNFAHFKKNVLDKAILALNSIEEFEIYCEPVKEGKKVVSVDFLIKDLEPRTYVKNSTNNIVNETIVEPPIEPTFDVPTLEVNIEEPITPPPIVETINSNGVDENACSYEILDLEEMTPAVRKRFIKDFKEYNFNLKCLQDSFDDALMITLEKDNVEVLGSSQYKHFKSTLIYKANDFIRQDIEKLEDKLEAMQHDTFAKPDLTDTEKQTIKIKCSNKIEQLEKMQNLVEKDAESIRK